MLSELRGTCHEGVCDPAKDQAAAASIRAACGSFAKDSLEDLVVLRQALVASGAEPSTQVGKSLADVDRSLAMLARTRLKAFWKERAWTAGRGWIAEHRALLGDTWAKQAWAEEALALESFAKATRPAPAIDELAIQIEALRSRTEGETVPQQARTLRALQQALVKLLDASLAESLRAADYEAAGARIAFGRDLAPPDWEPRARAAVVAKQASTTEAVTRCIGAPEWDTCAQVLEELSAACEASHFTCNLAARKALRGAFVKLLKSKEVTEDQRFAFAGEVASLPGTEPQDPLRQLGAQSLAQLGRGVEGRALSLAREGDFEGARAEVEAWGGRLGETWREACLAAVEAEEARQEARREADRARAAAAAERYDWCVLATDENHPAVVSKCTTSLGYGYRTVDYRCVAVQAVRVCCAKVGGRFFSRVETHSLPGFSTIAPSTGLVGHCAMGDVTLD